MLVKLAATSNPRRFAVAITGAALLAGCHSRKPAEPAPAVAFSPAQLPARSEKWQTQQIPAPVQADAPIKTGAPPLVYMIGAPTTVRISDMTSGQELLPATQVPARTLISINSGAGVMIGGATVRRGPLPDDHQYGIFLVPESNNTFRSGTIREGRPPLPEVQPPPASQPGGAP
jgi:hypothetical protein